MRSTLWLLVAVCLSVGGGLLAGCGGSGGGSGGGAGSAGPWLPRLFLTASPDNEVGVRLDGAPPPGAELSWRLQGSADAWQTVAPERAGVWRIGGLVQGTSVQCRLQAPSMPDLFIGAATAPAPDVPFTFGAYADSRSGADGASDVPHQALLNVLRSRSPRFVLHGGDLVQFGDRPAEWDHYLPLLQPLASEAPFVLALGNHEASVARYLERFGTESSSGEPWFFFDYGALRVIVLSTFEDAPLPAQTSFLGAALASGPALKVVLFHRPFDGPYRGPTASGTAYREAWKGLIESAGVNLVIWGHDHVYARRRTPGSTQYVLSGAGGSPFYATAPYAADWDYVALEQYEALAVTVTPGAATPFRVEVLKDDGTPLEPAFEF